MISQIQPPHFGTRFLLARNRPLNLVSGPPPPGPCRWRASTAWSGGKKYQCSSRRWTGKRKASDGDGNDAGTAEANFGVMWNRPAVLPCRGGSPGTSGEPQRSRQTTPALRTGTGVATAEAKAKKTVMCLLIRQMLGPKPER